MVDLTTVKEGEFFVGAVVRVESLHGNERFGFRQEAPVKFCGRVDATAAASMISPLKTIFLRDGTCKIVISGVMKAGRLAEITDLKVVLPVTATTTQPETRKYHKAAAAADHEEARNQVLLEGDDLLQYILDTYIPTEDLQTSVMPVHPLWATIGRLRLIDCSYRLVSDYSIDLEDVCYSIFMSARHGYNYITGNAFQNQGEFEQLMMAGAHICDLSLRRGGPLLLTNVYVKSDVLEALHLQSRPLLQVVTCPQTEEETRTAVVHPLSNLSFLRAAFVQLSRLTLNQGSTIPIIAGAAARRRPERHHIVRLGYELHNAPRFVPQRSAYWYQEIAADGLMCDELKQAGEALYGFGWYWAVLPRVVIET